MHDEKLQGVTPSPSRRLPRRLSPSKLSLAGEKVFRHTLNSRNQSISNQTEEGILIKLGDDRLTTEEDLEGESLKEGRGEGGRERPRASETCSVE